MRVQKTCASFLVSIPALGIIDAPLSATDAMAFVPEPVPGRRDVNTFVRVKLPDGRRLEKKTTTQRVGHFVRRTSRASLRTLALLEVLPCVSLLVAVEYTLEVRTTSMPMPRRAPLSAIVLVA